MVWVVAATAFVLLIAIVAIARRLKGDGHEKEQKAAQLAKMRQRVIAVEELIQTWQKCGGSSLITRQLYLVALDILDRIGVLAPSNSFSATEQERLLVQINQLPAGPAPPKPAVKLKSTAELASINNEFREIKRILHTRSNSEMLEPGLYDKLVREIDSLSMQLALDTYIDLSQEAVRQNHPDKAKKLLHKVLTITQKCSANDPGIALHLQTANRLMRQLPPRAAVND